MTYRRNLWAAALAIAAFAALFSLSFVATPVKFLAPHVSLADLLSVGRVTFRASLVLESALLIALVAVTKGGARWLAITAGVLLATQWFGLMPALDQRTLNRIAGTPSEPSAIHTLWIALDLARMAIYAITAIWALRAVHPGAGIAWNAGAPRLEGGDGGGRAH